MLLAQITGPGNKLTEFSIFLNEMGYKVLYAILS